MGYLLKSRNFIGKCQLGRFRARRNVSQYFLTSQNVVKIEINLKLAGTLPNSQLQTLENASEKSQSYFDTCGKCKKDGSSAFQLAKVIDFVSLNI